MWGDVLGNGVEGRGHVEGEAGIRRGVQDELGAAREGVGALGRGGDGGGVPRIECCGDKLSWVGVSGVGYGTEERFGNGVLGDTCSATGAGMRRGNGFVGVRCSACGTETRCGNGVVGPSAEGKGRLRTASDCAFLSSSCPSDGSSG